jgi:hypothetical protein
LTFEQSKQRTINATALFSEERATEISAEHRALLIDWLVDVSLEFNLRIESLFLAKHILDHYLAIATVARSQLQLIGITSLFIACKIEEIEPHSVASYLYICDDTYSRAELLQAERSILNVLGYDVLFVTELPFLQRFLDAACADMPDTTNRRVLHHMAHVCRSFSFSSCCHRHYC